jgi:hypothetical protein
MRNYMRNSILRLAGRKVRTLALVAGAVVPLAACESALLEYKDPDIITDAASADGALALKAGTIQRFTIGLGGAEQPDALFNYSGLITDEFISGDTFEQRNTTDQRDINATNSFLSGMTLQLNQVRTQGQLAIAALREYVPNSGPDVGLMYALSGFIENIEGENYCNGLVFSNIVDGVETLGDPIPVDSAFKLAVASADAAIAEAGSDAKVGNLARIVKGRALLNLARYSEAAAAVASVPTTYKYEVTYSANTSSNRIWGLNNSSRRYSVPEKEGGNGLPWRSANDPRLPVVDGKRTSFDSGTPFWYQDKWGQYSAIPVATGIEARMIEAEAALKAGQIATWLAKHNDARATVAGLGAMTDPGTDAARVDKHFYERGFWFWGTAHRLGDLRRLVRQYGRTAESVFPSGAYFKGGNYGTSYNIPVPIQETNNPNAVINPNDPYGSSCIDRNP